MEMRLKQTKRDTDDIPPQHSFADQEERAVSYTHLQLLRDTVPSGKKWIGRRGYIEKLFKDMIELIPAIDIIDGKCVRLTQGDYATKKVRCV